MPEEPPHTQTHSKRKEERKLKRKRKSRKKKRKYKLLWKNNVSVYSESKWSRYYSCSQETYNIIERDKYIRTHNHSPTQRHTHTQGHTKIHRYIDTHTQMHTHRYKHAYFFWIIVELYIFWHVSLINFSIKLQRKRTFLTQSWYNFQTPLIWHNTVSSTLTLHFKFPQVISLLSFTEFFPLSKSQ